MAYDLVARLRLRDEMTAKLRQAARSISQTRGIVDKLTGGLTKAQVANAALSATVNLTTRSFKTMGTVANTAFSSARSGATGVTSQITALAAAIGGAAAAYKLFDMTIGESARFELSKTQIEAMFQDQKKASQYMAMIQKRAIDSPVLSEKDMFANSKGLVAMTKDLKQLDKAWNIVERMSAMDPVQGIEGATFALRELMSGDAISMVERFEMPRSVMNSIKKLPIKEQLIAMDKLLNKMGFGNQFIEKMSAEAIPQWEKALEKVRAALRKMGEDGLRKIEPLLVRFNDLLDSPQMKKFTEYGGDLIAGTFEAIIQAGKSAASYFESHFVSNPAFQKLPDISSKISFVIDDLTKTFDSWLSSGGQNMLNDIGYRTVSAVAKAIEDNKQLLVNAGLVVGKALGDTILSSAVGVFSDLFTDPMQYGTAFQERKARNAQETFGFLGVPQPSAAEILERAERSKRNMAWFDNMLKGLGIGSGVTTPTETRVYGPPHPSAIKAKYTPQEFRYRREESKAAPASVSRPITINMQGLTIREEADVERIAQRLAREMQSVQ